tara:strand:+ start:86358 stop:87950 length:1593 start_codon:yes stop_codon:yes gene_type:complete
MQRIPGQATETATKNYADRMWQHNPKISPNSWRIFEGFTISKVGFGAYRTIGDSIQRAALKKALLNGVNIIDTSSNYMDGDSERFIGETLTELHTKNFLNREEIVIVTKGGYLQGTSLLEAENAHIEEIVKINDQLWHSIHPTNLERQLKSSLENLNVEHIDCYLLHNPEYFIGHAISQTEGVLTDDLKNLYYSRIEKAFEFLELKVKEGVIGCYGVSSNTFGVESDQGDHTDLALVFKAATNAAATAWGRKKRSAFRCIEMPFNLLELGALKTENTTAQIIDGEERVSTLELASRMHINVLANRPLNAFPMSGGVYRLSSNYSADEKNVPTVEEALGAIKQTEDVLNKVLNGWPSIDEQPLFSFTAHGDEILEEVSNSVQLDHMSTMFFTPHIAMMNHVIEEIVISQPEIADSLSLVRENFSKQAKTLLDALRKDMREKDAENLKILEIEIRDRLPESWKDAPLQQIAMNSIASVPGVTSVLCGMRREAYVQDALSIFEKGDFVDPASIIGVSEELEEDITFGDMGYIA